MQRWPSLTTVVVHVFAGAVLRERCPGLSLRATDPESLTQKAPSERDPIALGPPSPHPQQRRGSSRGSVGGVRRASAAVQTYILPALHDKVRMPRGTTPMPQCLEARPLGRG